MLLESCPFFRSETRRPQERKRETPCVRPTADSSLAVQDELLGLDAIDEGRPGISPEVLFRFGENAQVPITSADLVSFVVAIQSVEAFRFCSIFADLYARDDWLT